MTPPTTPTTRTFALHPDLDLTVTEAGDPYMHDPKLRHRLGRIQIPVLVLWGESDRIAPPAYGAAYAAAFPDAHFAVIKEAGHFPQIEQPTATFALIDAYVNDQQ